MLSRAEAKAWVRWRRANRLTWEAAASRYGVSRRHLIYIAKRERASARLEALIRADLAAPTLRERLARLADHPFWRDDA